MWCSRDLTHHVLSKERETLQRAHCLCGGVDVAEDHVRLAAHLHGLERNHVQNDAIGSKQHVEVALKVFLGQLVVEVADVQSAAVSDGALEKDEDALTSCSARPLCSPEPFPAVLVLVWP